MRFTISDLSSNFVPLMEMQIKSTEIWHRIIESCDLGEWKAQQDLVSMAEGCLDSAGGPKTWECQRLFWVSNSVDSVPVCLIFQAIYSVRSAELEPVYSTLGILIFLSFFFVWAAWVWRAFVGMRSADKYL